jgi:NADH dehydrogenase FAD-containing subunit
MKELGCSRVTIVEEQPHCLMDISDIDREVAAYIESMLVKQEIDIITKCIVHYLTETAVHSVSEPLK